MGKEKTLSTISRNSFIKSLHQDYYNTLKPFAMVMTQNENEAEELISLTFTKICFWSEERLQKVIGWNSHSICGYLAKILSNTHIDTLRKNKRHQQLMQNYSEDIGVRFEHSPETTYMAKENMRIIKHAYYESLSQVDRVVRVAFYLRTERGWRNKDIAEEFNQPVNTVGTNFRRLRLRIKDKIS